MKAKNKIQANVKQIQIAEIAHKINIQYIVNIQIEPSRRNSNLFW